MDLRRVAADAAAEAWRGDGVRLFRWPNGILLMTRLGTRLDASMIKHCADALLVTLKQGATAHEVLTELRADIAVHRTGGADA